MVAICITCAKQHHALHIGDGDVPQFLKTVAYAVDGTCLILRRINALQTGIKERKLTPKMKAIAER